MIAKIRMSGRNEASAPSMRVPFDTWLAPASACATACAKFGGTYALTQGFAIPGRLVFRNIPNRKACAYNEMGERMPGSLEAPEIHASLPRNVTAKCRHKLKGNRLADDNKKQTPLDWLGFNRWPDMPKPKWLGSLFGFLLSALFLIFIVATLITLYDFLRAGLRVGPYATDTDGSSLRNIGLVLAALLGAPFVVWRSIVAAKQAHIAEQGLVTDRLNEAVKNLGAEKTVTIQEKNKTYECNKPNIETRIGALYALERIAHDSARDAHSVTGILSTYIVENSKGDKSYFLSNHELSLNELHAGRLLKEGQVFIREDLRLAMKIVGKASLRSGSRIAGNQIRPDLRRLNLQRCFVLDINLTDAYLNQSDFYGATLHSSILNSSVLTGSDLRDCSFNFCEMRDVLICDVEVDASTRFHNTNISGSAFWRANLTDLSNATKIIEDTFGDASVELSSGTIAPDHWATEILNRKEFDRQWREWQRAIGHDLIG